MSTPRFDAKPRRPRRPQCRLASCKAPATQCLVKLPDLDAGIEEPQRWLYQIHGTPVACAYHAARIVRQHKRSVAALDRAMSGGDHA